MFEFDESQSPLLLPGSDYESAEPNDRIDYALEGITRFVSLVCLGVVVTLLCRWVSALLPFYWMGTIAVILALALPACLSRSAKLLTLAIALAVAIFAGWFDQLAFTTQQAADKVQEAIER